jgi:hypothetical protein
MRNTITYDEMLLVRTDDWKQEVTWKDFKSIESKFQDNDVIKDIAWKEQKKFTMWAGENDSDEYEYALYFIVTRQRLENDDEYVERLKREEIEKRERDKREYETYLTLKAKYEA